ncbi:MAG: hypothetical protein ACF8R7_14785 [Phycisphaerales bacterium JB039]
MNWLPIHIPATVTLGGLRLDGRSPVPDHLRNGLIPWSRTGTWTATSAGLLAPSGAPLCHNGRIIRARLAGPRHTRTAKRALRRAICRAWQDGSVDIRANWRMSNSGAAAGFACMLLAAIAGEVAVVVFAIKSGRDLVGGPLPMIALWAVVVLLMPVVPLAYGLAAYLGWQPRRVASLRANATGLRLVMTSGARRRIPWTSIKSIEHASAPSVRLGDGRRIWLHGSHTAMRELLDCACDSFKLRARAARFVLVWAVLLLVVPCVSAGALWWCDAAGLIPGTPPGAVWFIALAPAGAAGMLLLFLATAMAWERLARRHRGSAR